MPQTLLHLALATAVAIVGGIGAALVPSQPRNPAADAAREDLRQLVREITTRHPNPYYLTPKPAFDREVADLDARIPSLSPSAVVVELARIASLVGDGHTRANIPLSGGVLPIEIEWLDGVWRVVRTSAAHATLVGVKVASIDGVAMDDVHRRVNRLVAPHESEGFSRFNAGRLMTWVDVLDALRISKVRGQITVSGSTDAGEARSAMVVLAPRPPPGAWTEASSTTPLSRQTDLRTASFAWRAVPGTRTAYVAFNSYLTDGSRGGFGDLTRGAFRAMDGAAIDRLIIDLRWNGGGDFTRGREYVLDEIRKRERWLKPGALYALIGRRTFSAAMVNTVDFKKGAGAILVGEPTGARPNSYSETGFFVLANSGVRATVSICRYETWPDDVPGVPPDRSIPPTWADYRDGRDAALEWVLAQPAPDPSAVAFRQTTKLTPPCRRN